MGKQSKMGLKTPAIIEIPIALEQHTLEELSRFVDALKNIGEYNAANEIEAYILNQRANETS